MEKEKLRSLSTQRLLNIFKNYRKILLTPSDDDGYYPYEDTIDYYNHIQEIYDYTKEVLDSREHYVSSGKQKKNTRRKNGK